MALQELGTIRGLVRNLIGEPVQKDFTNPELNAIITLVQNEVIRRLMRVNTVWFASSAQLSAIDVGVAAKYTLPTDCGEIVSVRTLTGKIITIKPLSEHPYITSNPMHAASTNDPCAIQISNKLYVYPPSITTIIVDYIQKGLELTTDSETTILPLEFIDILVAGVIAKCAAKAGLDVAQKEKEYDEMFPESELRKRKDVDEAKAAQGERQ